MRAEKLLVFTSETLSRHLFVFEDSLSRLTEPEDEKDQGGSG